jgi:polo-like kinase 1
VDALKKKVTLLQHFRSYLLEQQKRAEDNGEVDPLGNNNDGLVYMKKWIRTKHAMLFRLSDGTVQVRSLEFDTFLMSIVVSLDLYCHPARYYSMI